MPAWADLKEPLTYGAVGAGCLVIGVPTCGLFMAKKEDHFSRPASEYGGQIRYSVDVAIPESITAHQRLTANGYVSNVAFEISHRRGFSDLSGYQVTSYRVGYNYGLGDFIPVIGVGYRTAKQAQNDTAFELWLPLYLSQSALTNINQHDKILLFLETHWVFGNNKISPEGEGGIGFRLADNFFLLSSLGYFLDLPKSSIEISVGPSYYF